MRVILLLFICLFTLLTGCKENWGENKVTETENKAIVQDTLMSASMAKKPESAQIKQMNEQALAILQYRRENKPKNYAIIDVGVWAYEAAFKDGAMSKPGEYDGHWIDFDENNNYEFGIKNQVKGSGKYHYDNDSQLLLLVNNNPEVKPEEYELKLVNDIMIMMGKTTYQDNGFQAKLVKISERPN